MSNVEHDRLISEPDWSQCEELIEAFESAWRAGQQPAVHEFVRGDGDLRRTLLIELVHTDLEFRVKSGETVRVETYLASFPELAVDRQTTLGLIAAEYEFRRRRSGVSIAEYQARFPDHARDLNLGVTRADDDTRGFPQTALATDPKAWPEVPGFEILAELGRGGMGIVYQARELALGRHVALKFLPADYMHDHERLERFQREARTTSALNHPHICTIHGLGEQNGRPYIVMELVEGRTLQAVISERPSVDEALRIIAQAARALAAAHSAGVVHRDIKPDNIMLRSDGYVKVLDFGLARRLPTLLESDSLEAGHTDPCVILGTVAYMSPEQARGAAAQSASDIFSLGIVLYQLLTGKHPFEGASAADILTAITTRHPLSPSRFNLSVSRHLDDAIDAMLQKDVELRPSAVAVEAAIAAARGARRRWIAATSRTRPIVHREAELAVLRSTLADAEAGRGSILCIAGEPGIGKTTLVEDFLSELAPAEVPWLVARGQCSERLADTEAYVPVIDALQNLVRNDATGWVARLISVVAPTWDGLIASNRNSSPVEGSSRALSQPAMLREFCALLEEASRQSVIVLFFDDVHWSDNSTVDLLAHLGRHCQRLRVVAVVTYRPTEMLLRPHPFHAVKLELQGRGECRELALGFLTRDEIDHFLSLLFPDHRFSPDFANEIYRRTEGNALFIADLLEYLRQRDVIVHSDGQWALARQLPDLRDELPESVRSMIERKFMQLDKSDRQLLAAAAVQGHEFDSAVVAGALGLDAADVEERLQSLDRVHHLVRLLREQEFPNRVLTQRYSFVHALYQQAMYNDLPPTRRASLAAALAQTMERLVCDDKSAAAELACLYEVGRDFQAAVRHFYQATENAAQVFAHREAIALAQRGLELLDSLPDAKRTEPEIRLQTALGLQLQVTKGYAAPDAQRAYMRARELCLRSPELSLEFPVLWGLWLCHKVRSDLLEAQEVAQQLLILARQLNNPALALQAHQALGMTGFCRGEQTAALRNIEQVAAIYDPVRHGTHSATFGQDPGVICKAYGAVVLWLLGFPDTARQQSRRAIEMSHGISPTSEAVALHFAAMVEQLCRNAPRCREFTERTIAVADQHGLSFWMAGAAIFSGWALVEEGAKGEGLARLRQGISDWRATGSVTYETYYLALLAEVLAGQAQLDEALQVLEESLALVHRTGEKFYEPELYRLRGEVLLLAADQRDPSARKRTEQDFRHARDLASAQKVRSLELRAAMSLADLSRRFGAPNDGRTLLAEVYSRFSEGFQSSDLRCAKAILDFTD